MIAAALNNSGFQLYGQADFARVVLSAEKILADLFQDWFAATTSDDRDAVDSTALLDIQDVKNSLEGDNEAYKRLVERHQRQISAMMWRFSRDRIVHEELVQDVFVQVYISLPTFKRKAPFTHWLHRIATRVGFSYWKKKARINRINTISIEDFDQASMTATESSAPDKAAEMLHGMLEKLPPRDRLVLTLRYLQQNSIIETAELTGWTVGMVKIQTWRAKNKFKKLYKELVPQGEK